jgi:DNA-binding NtrC family response regulator
MDRTASQGKVLVVDDEVTLRMLLRKALAKTGCHVEVADDGENAIRMLEVDTFDVVVLDINMPRVTGHQLAKQIEKKYPDLPVIFMTAEADANNVKKAYAEGAKDFLVKPFDDIDRVVTKILEVIEVSRAQAKTQKALHDARQALGTKRDRST